MARQPTWPRRFGKLFLRHWRGSTMYAQIAIVFLAPAMPGLTSRCHPLQ